MYELLEGHKRASKDVIKLTKIRKDGFIPGIIFGKGLESMSIMIGNSLFAKCLTKNVSIIELVIGGDKLLVNIDSVQREPVSGQILHVSFLKLQADKETTVAVPIIMVGENTGEGIVGQLLQEINVTALPQYIPGQIEVNIEGLEIGTAVMVRDLSVPDKVKFSDTDLGKPVANCSAPAKEEEEEVETPEEGEEGVEGETSEDKPAETSTES